MSDEFRFPPRPSGSPNESRIVASYESSPQKISISEPFNPWEFLGLQSSQASLGEVKAAFKSSIKQSDPQQRALVSLGYHVIKSSGERYKRVPGTDKYVVGRRDHFFLAACGHVKELSQLISGRRSLVKKKDENESTLLYTASRSGFYEVCELLLQNDASVDEQQRDGSTPLHAAAFYGHERVIKLLLLHGARTDIENNWGNTALCESASDGITKLIQSASFDQISFLVEELRTKEIVVTERVIKHKEEVIAKELIRDLSVLDAPTQAKWQQILKSWEIVWHGTQYRHLQSILERGLLPAGSRGITPPPGHIKLKKKVFDVSNWAAATFVSPSILYASHEVYSQRVFSGGHQWCVLVKASCNREKIKSYNGTVDSYKRKDDEPEKLEYRVAVDEEDKNVFLLIESTRDVVVRSVMFVRVSFLEDQNLNLTEALTLLN